jgi:hypothetical protein
MMLVVESPVRLLGEASKWIRVFFRHEKIEFMVVEHFFLTVRR